LSRKLARVALVALAPLVAAGCGTSGRDASVRSGTHGAIAVQPADGAAAAGLQTVSYHGAEFDVPADWPVHDLAADPTTCVRFDVHAVYLGRPGVDMACPADVVGRVDAVLVQPVEGVTAWSDANAVAGAAGDVSSTDVNGLHAEVVDGGDVTFQVDAMFPAAGVSATLTYQDSNATAQQILGSFRGVAR